MSSPNPWKPDPADPRVPIGAPDTTASASRERVDSRRGLLFFESRSSDTFTRAFTTMRESLSVRLCAITHNPFCCSVISMHRHRASIIQSMASIPHQARVHPFHMFLIQISKGFVGKIHRVIVQIVQFAFSHSRIMGGAGRLGHSYFPMLLGSKNFDRFDLSTPLNFVERSL